ncbi:MAG: DNA repair protein, partial [Limisphaerales bacterium]
VSEEVRISLERVNQDTEAKPNDEEPSTKLTSSKMAQRLGMKTGEFIDKLVAARFLEFREGKQYLTAKGKDSGGEFRMSPKFGPFFLWPENFKPQ